MKACSLMLSLLLVAPLSFANNTDTKTNPDQEIVAGLVVLNNNEITVADLALGKANDKHVKEYAKLMKKEHDKNLKETLKISKKQDITPVDDQNVTDLKTQGQQEASDLNKLSSTDFDKAYINDMVKDHEAALTLLNGYLKEVTNPKLKKHLEDTTKHVQHHLDAAKKIQSQLS
ncbi:DUF4142 domain-containing protein [Legionella sp. km772]|uniref:DUF4142 domain-containing protein n=1 Tax=Legionella sp. km772 TaxID=2498111 RepID=UPI000F8DDD1A|nr:DUF4142 domain-containing protein [Legionella sp. km772]RUR10990.1 DUF4142 domain-containing protein [Legionella sp. km772]